MAALSRRSEARMDNLAAYSAMPYPGQVTSETHPDNLAVVAHLLGVKAANPRTARVLEIGCADGGNLVPMAARLPEASFVGLDLAPGLLAAARAYASDAGVQNVTWVEGDITELADGIGTFDYIIVHGVWSWVRPDARTAILRGIRSALAEDGIAYVSYNVFPGWGLRSPARRFLRWHVRNTKGAAEQVASAKALSGWLAKMPRHRRALGSAMRGVLDSVSMQPDWYVFHEYLAGTNEPVFFHEFMEHAASADLAYLGEARFDDLVPVDLPGEIQDKLEDLAEDRQSYEQYLDFVRERAFRRTLLVRPPARSSFALDSERLDALHVGARLRLPPDFDSEGVATSIPVGRNPSNAKDVMGSAARTPAERAALRAIGRAYPGTVSVAELVRDSPTKAPAIRRMLLIAFLERSVRFFFSPHACEAASDMPEVHPVNRAAARIHERSVAHRWHGQVRCPPAQRWLMERMDGSMSVDELGVALQAVVEAGDVPLPESVDSPSEIPAWTGQAVRVFAETLLLEST